ncbi:MAG TPA: S9 family peptidase [Sphingomicrobium sp.]|nr:S9 family peptidase [Sphingomicrobium sp.]
MRLSIAAGLAAGLAFPAGAATLHQFTSLALSPAGDRVAALESDSAPDAPALPHEHIVLRSASTGRTLVSLDPCAACNYSDLTFSPGGRLAFLASSQGKTQLMAADGATVVTLATINGIAQQPRFSPDGSKIALLVTIGARKQAGATQAGVRQVGEIGEENDEQQIALVPAAGGALKPITPADRYVYEYDWMPDGSGFVATSALGNGDNNWWIAELDRVDASSGAVTRIAAPNLQMNQPRVSPDGRSVAFIGGIMSDFGSVGGDVYTVPVAGGDPVDRTANYRGTFTSLLWNRGGLVASALIGERSAIVPFDRSTAPALPTWSAPVSIAAGGARIAGSASGSMVAFVEQDFEHPQEIYAGPLSAPRQITHDNDGWAPLVSAQSLTWKSGPYSVQGWLLAPRGGLSGKAPMVTSVHGGPAAANVPSFVWQGTYADLARAGYYLFLPNPRGSYGQGEAFTRANVKDFGGGDLKDILAGVDAAERAAPIDDSRLGLTGYSYGGFMAMWANTQTDRFKAIVAGGGLSDWLSYYGLNGIDQWMIPYFGKSMYDDPDAYWAVSAIRTIKNAKTPTLIIAGERDIEVPPTQSIEYWHALRAMNVPASLVIYQGEGHGIRDPKNVLDMRRRTVAWFDRYLGRGKMSPPRQ